jgi:hypothetical protein
VFLKPFSFYQFKIIVCRVVELAAHCRDRPPGLSSKPSKMLAGSRGRLPLRDISINIRREATPNLFTITYYLLPREALNPNLIF